MHSVLPMRHAVTRHIAFSDIFFMYEPLGGKSDWHYRSEPICYHIPEHTLHDIRHSLDKKGPFWYSATSNVAHCHILSLQEFPLTLVIQWKTRQLVSCNVRRHPVIEHQNATIMIILISIAVTVCSQVIKESVWVCFSIISAWHLSRDMKYDQ